MHLKWQTWSLANLLAFLLLRAILLTKFQILKAIQILSTKGFSDQSISQGWQQVNSQQFKWWQITSTEGLISQLLRTFPPFHVWYPNQLPSTVPMLQTKEISMNSARHSFFGGIFYKSFDEGPFWEKNQGISITITLVSAYMSSHPPD